MARPTKSKDMKGKPLEAIDGGAGAAGGSGGSGPSLITLLVVAIAIMVGTAGATIAAVYFLMPMVMKPLIAEMAPEGGGKGGHNKGGGEALPTVGPVIDLEEFTVNLSDESGDRYLRADLSLTVTTDDPNFETLAGEAMKKWEEEFHIEMAHYVPAIRDIVISSLTRRTAADLSSEEGKTLFKNEVKEKVDKLFAGHHKVIRVNIENFIIQ